MLEEVVIPFMQDVTYSSRNIATLGPLITVAVTINNGPKVAIFQDPMDLIDG